jgi:hypothetical protein
VLGLDSRLTPSRIQQPGAELIVKGAARKLDELKGPTATSALLTVLRFYGFTEMQLHRFTLSQKYGFTPIPLSHYTDSSLPNAQLLLYAGSFIQKHRVLSLGSPLDVSW